VEGVKKFAGIGVEEHKKIFLLMKQKYTTFERK
jgi:hypothetical protein